MNAELKLGGRLDKLAKIRYVKLYALIDDLVVVAMYDYFA